jgi:hypothetical protein
MKCSNLTLIFLVCLCTQLLGCKKEDPNPELMDPIYSDLLKRATDSQKAFDEATAKLVTLQENLEKAEPNSIDVKDIQKEIAKTEAQKLRASQESLYFKIRSERRKFEDRIEYKKALAKDQPWPDKHEYSDYLVNIRLREINPNWGARVPKLQDRMTASAPPKKAEAAGGEKAEAPKEEH